MQRLLLLRVPGEREDGGVPAPAEPAASPGGLRANGQRPHHTLCGPGQSPGVFGLGRPEAHDGAPRIASNLVGLDDLDIRGALDELRTRVGEGGGQPRIIDAKADRGGGEERGKPAVPRIALDGIRPTAHRADPSSPGSRYDAPPNGSGMLRPQNLLTDFTELGSLLSGQLEATASALGVAGATERCREELLDTFLVAAGMNQILEDYLHRDLLSLGKVVARLGGGGKRLRPATGVAVRSLRGGGLRVRDLSRSERALVGRQQELAVLVQRLAEEVAEAASAESREDAASGGRRARWAEDALGSGRALLARGDFPAALKRSVLRLPNCFRGFDQRPADCRRLAQLFASRRADRASPLVVVGLRTSGSYLAPLCAAFLKAEGFRSVDVLTLRPGQHWLRGELRALRAAVGAGGLALLVDDPPRTGAQLSRAAGHLQELGVPRRSLVLLLPIFDASSLPAVLQQYEAVLLPWHEWAVHGQLAPQAVREALAGLLDGRAGVLVGEVSEARMPELPPSEAGSPPRGHVAAVFRVELLDREAGTRIEQDVYVRGVGIGYFGRHSLAVAGPLVEFVPHVYGFREGLVYRSWLPEEWRLSAERAAGDARIAGHIASYALARSRALPVAEDVSERLVGRDAAWEYVAAMLGRAFGRAELVLRPVTGRTARRLVRTPRPSVIDGNMRLSQWFAPPDAAAAEDALRKVEYDERAFSASGLCMYSFDPVADLAGAAADYEGGVTGEPAAPDFAERLRTAYEERSGEPIPGERWLLYQLAHHLVSHERLLRGEARPGAAVVERLLPLERAMARAHQRYFGELFFGDLRPPTRGRLCAIDVDGVLETRWLSYPAIGPAGALALRALARHGFRPVLVTGRSLAELRERCVAYRLAGGVAEYGAVLFNHLSGEVRPLLTESEEADLDALRAVLRGTPGVRLDPAHCYGVRAYLADRAGERRGLGPELVDSALAESGIRERLRPIPGELQTDFTVARIDKGAGLRALVEELGSEAPALAVGDSGSDLPMLALAARPFAPANADAALRAHAGRARIRVTRRPYQSGLVAAVSSLLGHRPQRCSDCAPPALSADARLLLTVLAAHDGGKWGKARQALLLVARSRGSSAAVKERGDAADT